LDYRSAMLDFGIEGNPGVNGNDGITRKRKDLILMTNSPPDYQIGAAHGGSTRNMLDISRLLEIAIVE
jgi:hypothetical protein